MQGCSAGNATPIWRNAAPSDLDAIEAIASVVHVSLHERRAVLTEKLRLFPAGCLVLCRTGAVLGYALSHPWTFGTVPPLDHFLGALPRLATCLFIHDVAILPAAQGHGAGRSLIPRIDMAARRHKLNALALVSVYDTQSFWTDQGFAVLEDATLHAKLATYGASARYMVKPLRVEPSSSEPLGP